MFLSFSTVVIGWLIRYTHKQWCSAREQVPNLFDFRAWLIRGALIPALIWMFFNAGFFRALPPLIPHVAVAKTGKHFVAHFVDNAITGCWHIAFLWCAVTFAWQLVLLYPRCVPRRREFFRGAGQMSLICSPIIVFVVWMFGPYSIGFAAMIWSLLVMQFALTIASTTEENRPQYHTAQTRINMGRLNEAELEIVEQLEKREDDYEGWMMLATLYATRDNDVAAAEKVVCDIIAQKNLTQAQVIAALEKLARWQLKLADDPVGARASLSEICRRYPKTEQAETARLRLESIPATREEWLERKERIDHSPRMQW